MKYGVIDIGSNSVRLMISDGVRTLNKTVKTTQLAKGLTNNTLQEQAVLRTAQAVSFFYNQAKEQQVDEIYAFATAAVRKATNKQLFIDKVKDLCGLEVEVISGETEAELGCLGALGGLDGGVIDVGGASTEISVYNNKQKIYGKSIYLGAVNATDISGQDKVVATSYILEKLKEFNKIPKSKFYAIGGTATSLAALIQELEPYDPLKTDGFIIDVTVLEEIVDKLFSLSVEKRKQLKGLQPARAEVIANGALIVLEIMKNIGLTSLIVSEKDNLEGYLINKRKKL